MLNAIYNASFEFAATLATEFAHNSLTATETGIYAFGMIIVAAIAHTAVNFRTM